MEKIKEFGPIVLAVITLLLVGSIKMDTVKVNKAHAKVAKVEKHHKAERGQRGSRRGRVAPSSRPTQRGSSRRGRGSSERLGRMRGGPLALDKNKLEALKDAITRRTAPKSRGDSKSSGSWKRSSSSTKKNN